MNVVDSIRNFYKEPLRVFCGYDAREAVGWHVFAQSVLDQARRPVALIPVGVRDRSERDGSNAFTYSRFLVPKLCAYKGLAVFVDGADMLVRGDLTDLFDLWDGRSAVQVVKHDYRTGHPRKYVGTAMESANVDYPRKNWSSVTLWDCGSFLNRPLDEAYVARHDHLWMHGFQWLPEDRIGTLPAEWNWMADEQGPNPAARLLHWTAGVPGMAACRNEPHADEWFANLDASIAGLQR